MGKYKPCMAIIKNDSLAAMKNVEILKKAVKILHEGGLVAFPTETVYGLGADAKNPEAVRKIFLAKGRPADHPVIVHIPEASHLSFWAVDISLDAKKLAQAFWPGPLTLILKKAPEVSDVLTGGQETLGVRVPRHLVAQALLQIFNGGIAAPSANRFGRISPTTASAVYEELNDQVDLILEGGQCEVGVESTIVDVSSNEVRVLRPGMITVKQIETVLGKKISDVGGNVPRVSGSLESHYAPTTEMRIVAKNKLEDFLNELSDDQLPVGVLAHSKIISQNTKYDVVRMSEDPKLYAHDLYLRLREMDKKNYRKIIVEAVPESEEWEAVRDRLKRAASFPEFLPS